MSDDITYLFPNFSGAAVEVWECLSDFLPYIFILNIGPLGTNQWNFNQNSIIFIQENGIEKVICKTGDLIS